MDRIDVVPLPQVVLRRPGAFLLDGEVALVATGMAVPAAWLLHDLLRPGTGYALRILSTDDGVTRPVVLKLDLSRVAHPEGYLLDVQPDRVDLVAATVQGLGWAVQTFRQLLPSRTLRSAPVAAGPIEVGCVSVADEPRFPWRGLMLDVARHFMRKDFLLRMVDLAALHRLNVLHLHLNDDQGWRLEVPSWPRLTEAGCWRPETATGPTVALIGHDGTPHGGFYRIDDLREIVGYAAGRGLTVVPEMGIPGHTQAALSAYPELGTTSPHPVRTRWGHSPHVLAPCPEALEFIIDVLDVVTDVFPSPFVHIGGDECPRDEWRASGYARKRAAELGLPSVDSLQSWFLRAAITHLASRQRRAVGWDQVMEDGGVPGDTVVMCWRDWVPNLAAMTMAAGHDVVQCPADATYLDHYQSDHPGEPVAFPKTTTLTHTAGYDPVPPELMAVQGAGVVLGTQAHLWTEHMSNPRQVEYMAFPRLAAVAEAAWTGMDRRREHPLDARLLGYLSRLDALGVEYRPPTGPLPWQEGGSGARCRD
ncbi:MAG: beta-N-acetylhexosaminidase [Pseudonocardiales bacterium]|nr:beta-N-acetylhexosaminidase [Pseudonocardiales bacterium]